MMKKLLIKIIIYLFCGYLFFIGYVVISYFKNDGRLTALDILDKSVINNGNREMEKHKVIITGITRDNIIELPTMRKYIEKTGAYFSDYKVVIFENDSTDGTKEFLKKWQDKNDKVKIISVDFHNKKRPSIAFMAKVRNYYLNEIENNSKYDDFDILMIVDMDMIYGWDMRGVAHSFANIDKWSAVCANGVHTIDGKMYDMFAFRNDEIPNCSEENIKRGQRVYPVGSDFVKVRSCFNGMAFYKREYIKGCKYYSEGDCEHIYFHQCILDNGGKMFMNPSNQILYFHHPGPLAKEKADLPKNIILRKIYKEYISVMKRYYFKIAKIENYLF